MFSHTKNKNSLFRVKPLTNSYSQGNCSSKICIFTPKLEYMTSDIVTALVGVSFYPIYSMFCKQNLLNEYINMV